jgi:hypothetical protein
MLQTTCTIRLHLTHPACTKRVPFGTTQQPTMLVAYASQTILRYAADSCTKPMTFHKPATSGLNRQLLASSVAFTGPNLPLTLAIMYARVVCVSAIKYRTCPPAAYCTHCESPNAHGPPSPSNHLATTVLIQYPSLWLLCNFRHRTNMLN